MSVNGTEIAIGQRWLTRDGQEVTVVSNDGHYRWPWNLSDETSVTDEGFCLTRDDIGDSDLITLIQDEHGFIPWNGGECPVPDHIEIEAKLRCGDLENEVAEWFDWSVSGNKGDIIAYRVVKQEVKPAKVDAEEEKQPKQDKEIVKMNQKYTVKDVLYALDNLSEHYVELDLEEQIEEYLAVRESADYKLYLELKARFETTE